MKEPSEIAGKVARGSKRQNWGIESVGRRSDLFQIARDNQPFFSLKLCYEGERLTQAYWMGNRYANRNLLGRRWKEIPLTFAG